MNSYVLPLFQFCSPLFQAGIVQPLNAQYVLVCLSSASDIEELKNPHLSDSHEFEWKGSLNTSIVYLSVSICFVAVLFYFLSSFRTILAGVAYLDYHLDHFKL